MGSEPSDSTRAQVLPTAFDHFVQSLSDGVVLIDAHWKIHYANNRARALFNLKEDQVHLAEHLKTHFVVAADFSQLDLRSGKVRIEAHRQESDHYQPLYLVLQSFHPDSWPNQDLIPFLIKDQTEKHLEDVIKADFLTLISHKMRTPVVALSYAMSLIQRRNELAFAAEEVDDFLEQAAYKAFEISEMVEKLIRYCSVVKDQFHERFETFRLRKMIEEVIERYNRKYQKLRPPFEIRIQDIPENLMVCLPHEYGSLLFENLIDNALKFCVGDKALCVIRAEAPQGKQIICVVEDNGPGIPSESVAGVFDAYHQIEKHFSGAVEGVGLGLTLVRHILEVYHQSIRIESDLGQGTRVFFTLPLQA